MAQTRKILLAIIIGLFICSSQASAQVMIEQGKVVIKANPGESVVNALTVHNTGKDALILRVYWEDFLYIEPFNGTKKFMAAGTSDRSMNSWLTFSPQQFTLEAASTKKINYSVLVPENAKGGYYGVLFIEASGAQSKDQIGLTIVTRMGSLFFVETTNSTWKGRVENLKFGEKEFAADFVNEGDVVLIPDATYYYLDKEGLVAERGEIKKFYLAPGKTVGFKVPVGEALAANDYTAILTFDFGGGNNVTHEFDFKKSADGAIAIKN